MKYHLLGRSPLQVSVIGFGCMSLTPGERSNEAILQEAADLGINFFDTADLYNKGENERMVGTALKAKRKEIILATKGGNQWKEDGSGWDWNAGKAYLLSAVEASLQRLQTDYIDLYQLHGGMITDNIDETIEAFELLKQQGKIRAYGISSIRPNVIRAYTEKSRIDSVMMQYSLLDRRPEETCIDLLKTNQISVLSRGGLAQGLLVNKPARDYTGLPATLVQQAASEVRKLVTPERTAAQAALQFVLQHVPVAIAGIRTQDQLREIAATVDAPPLTLEQLQRLRNSVPALSYKEHR